VLISYLKTSGTVNIVLRDCSGSVKNGRLIELSLNGVGYVQKKVIFQCHNTIYNLETSEIRDASESSTLSHT